MQLEALLAGLSRASATSVQHAVAAAAQLPRIGPCRDEHRLAGAPPLPSDRQRVLALLGTPLAGRGAAGRRRLRRGPRAGPRRPGGGRGARLAAADRRRSPPRRPLARRRRQLPRGGEDPRGHLFPGGPRSARGRSRRRPPGSSPTSSAIWGRARGGRRWSRHADVALALLGPDDEVCSAPAPSTIAPSSSTLPAPTTRPGRCTSACSPPVSGCSDPITRSSPTPSTTSPRPSRSRAPTTEAKALQERALAIRERALGPDHPDIALSLNNLAAVHEVTGAYAEARALHERAVAIREGLRTSPWWRCDRPPRHPRCGWRSRPRGRRS